MRKILAGFVLLMLCGLTGCTGFPGRDQEIIPVSGNDAVVSLVNAAQSDIDNGKYDAASATLERALRLEPRNPALWNQLAKLRMQQGQYQQAEGLAARSNGWSVSNKILRAENWRIIGESRLKRGDYPGAQAAFDKAAEAN
jgi:tetratricopeptide (TPR) repeat protein